eukprot:7455671-Lingulodinium_polyedra.AAC.1
MEAIDEQTRWALSGEVAKSRRAAWAATEADKLHALWAYASRLHRRAEHSRSFAVARLKLAM